MADSTDPDALLRTARTHLALGRDAEGVAAFERAIAGGAGTTRDHLDLGMLLHRLGRHFDAIDAFERARAFDPGNLDAALNLGRLRIRVGDIDAAIDDLTEADGLGGNLSNISDLLYASNFAADRTETEVAAVHRRFGARFGAPVRAATDFDHLPSGPIRVGLLSADLRVHPIGWYLRPLLPRLAASGLELVAFSDARRDDHLSNELRRSCTVWQSTSEMGDAALETLVVESRCHVLLELVGHTASSRLGVAARRLAPVQIAWMGYANTTGVEAIDYVIGDRMVTPPASHEHFTERVITMPGAAWCYVAPEFVQDARRTTRHDERGPTFGCLGNPSKINSRVIGVWARVLEAVPEARLFLRFHTYEDPRLRQRLRSAFASQGVDAERLEFRGGGSPPEMVAEYRDIDVALDTFPFSGCTTNAEAMAMGTPVVSMPSRGIAGRHGATHVLHGGLEDWVVPTEDAFVERAIAGIRDRDGLAEIRDTLPERLPRTALGDADRFAANLAKAIRHAVARWRDGAPREAFEVAKLD